MKHPLTLTHCGNTNETDAVRAVLLAYGYAVVERRVSSSELAQLARLPAAPRMHFYFGEKTFHSLGGFLNYLVDNGGHTLACH